MRTLQERFWSHVSVASQESCWEWMASTVSGYGCIGDKGKTFYAHRLSYEFNVGEIGNQCVLHKCDNRKCVNPKHLFLGSRKDNMFDKVIKNRQTKGERNGVAKLTDEIVRLVRNDIRTHREIAITYNVSQTLISLVKNKRIWSHVS